MSQKVHIFIATTKGLVAVQSVVDLQDASLQSVLTINGSPDLVNVSAAYHGFIEKNTGIIKRHFGGAAYRTNLASNIEQGSSWQLGIFTAHWIKSIESETAYSLGDGNVEAGDFVFCLTGQVNTSSGKVESISGLAEKITSANPHVSAWARKGALVSFFYPEDNALSHFPELLCKAHSLKHIDDLHTHFAHFLPTNSMQGEVSTYYEMEGEASDRASNLAHEISANAANDYKRDTSIFKSIPEGKLKQVLILMLTVLFAAVSAAIYLSFSKTEHNDTMNLNLSYFITSKNGGKCDANSLLIKKDIKQQFVSKLPAQFISELCSIDLVTNVDLPQIWMITDTKTVMELSSFESSGQQMWRINLPRMQTENRQFILLVTSQKLDLSDLASLTDYLSGLPVEEKASVETLAEFFTRTHINPRYLTQTLMVEKP
ncbi:hypothetical protein ISG33_06590 [Glaciecola sp. MH2013]|uniref:hypothetical protein n=1 Tax=Glaciecola sp. MH2013 TaxID=2785524 RepID=UPI00189DC378|nr:hypothetical protein [Glaciecola sp. MH2013]MBF7073064.1 hypothetical protein [Glaciecola sp. MH2013]